MHANIQHNTVSGFLFLEIPAGCQKFQTKKRNLFKPRLFCMIVLPCPIRQRLSVKNPFGDPGFRPLKDPYWIM